jgi:hypothetical protein
MASKLHSYSIGIVINITKFLSFYSLSQVNNRPSNSSSFKKRDMILKYSILDMKDSCLNIASLF